MRNYFIGMHSKGAAGAVMARISGPLRFGALALLAIGTACAITSAWPRAPSGSFDQRCEAWDRDAAAAIAALIAERDAIADRQLGDAVFRLRRARNNCRNNLAVLAWFDYRALTDGRYSKLR
jgi:hypothetical protein